MITLAKLNLGCGHEHLDGWCNVDILDPCDLRMNLNDLPWPLESGKASSVRMHNSMEHLKPDPLVVLAEVWRILAPGGTVDITVPDIRGKHGVSFGHLHFFSESMLRELGAPPPYAGDAIKPWRDCRLTRFSAAYYRNPPSAWWKQALVATCHAIINVPWWPYVGLMPADFIRWEATKP